MPSGRVGVVTTAQPVGELRGIHAPLVLDGAVA